MGGDLGRGQVGSTCRKLSGSVSWADRPVVSGGVSGLHVEASRTQVGDVSGVSVEAFSEKSV